MGILHEAFSPLPVIPVPGGECYKSRLEYILNSEALILFSTDRYGRIDFLEGEGLARTGFQSEDLVGISIQELDWTATVRSGNAGLRIFSPSQILKSVLQGEEVEAEAKFSGRIFRSRFSPLRYESGEIQGMIGLSLDITEAKKSELAFAQSSRDFRTAIEGLPIVVFSFNPVAVITFAEGGGLKRLGLLAEDLVGKNIFERSEGDPESMQALRASLKGEESRYTLRIKGRSFETRLYPRFDEKGRITQVLGVSNEITIREAFEKRIAESESNYRNLFENNSQIMFLFEYDSLAILKANGIAKSAYGYDGEEFLRKTLSDLMPPEEFGQFTDRIRGTGSRPNFIPEVRHLKKNGERFYVDITATRFEFNGKDCVLVAGAEVTERVQSEREKRFNLAILSQISDAVIALDSERRIIYYNKPAEEMYEIEWGYNPIGKPYSELFRRDWMSEENKRAVMEEYERYGQASAEVIHILRSGKRIRIDCNFKKIKDEDGNDIGSVMVIRDITDKVRVRESLERAINDLETTNQELEQFAYVASHDLQEPLRTIASYLRLLERRCSPQLPEEGKEFIQITVDAVKRQQNLIESLLNYSRLGAKIEVWEKIQTESLLKDVVHDLFAGLNAADVDFRLESEMPVIVGGPEQIRQLFLNLITNAVKFRSKERRPVISVSARESREEWEFKVADNGIGMDPKYFDKIFIIFQKLHSLGEYPGTGIGLSVCKRIVENHAGRIWVVSDEARGSEFFFTIPKRGSE
ncbi:PAS domain S-box protein [Leptospira fluminis]|uniref:histidine kinase n=1 Tax=Leptospira fluminis TaxID=2484979 RepID=A0A4R9GRL6_9LEPT|nr:PAS domain S-box protein [Leptospira fluminis]TGK19247.1 PAS domain S-box protein [Leptospira fluminis]